MTLPRPLQKRPDMPLDDVVALYISLVNLALKCYPENIDYVDKALQCTWNIFSKRDASPYVSNRASIQACAMQFSPSPSPEWTATAALRVSCSAC